eukprot:COSAG06_NODE_1528_length_9183_cov_265.329811_3_plen_953_part_00
MMLLVYGGMTLLHLPNWVETIGMLSKAIVVTVTTLMSSSEDATTALVLLLLSSTSFAILGHILRQHCGVGFVVVQAGSVLEIMVRLGPPIVFRQAGAESHVVSVQSYLAGLFFVSASGDIAWCSWSDEIDVTQKQCHSAEVPGTWGSKCSDKGGNFVKAFDESSCTTKDKTNKWEEIDVTTGSDVKDNLVVVFLGVSLGVLNCFFVLWSIWMSVRATADQTEDEPGLAKECTVVSDTVIRAAPQANADQTGKIKAGTKVNVWQDSRVPGQIQVQLDRDDAGLLTVTLLAIKQLVSMDVAGSDVVVEVLVNGKSKKTAVKKVKSDTIFENQDGEVHYKISSKDEIQTTEKVAVSSSNAGQLQPGETITAYEERHSGGHTRVRIDGAPRLVVVSKAVVRSEVAVDSKKVGTLKPGETVAVRETAESGGHVRVLIGKDRWVSRTTADGHVLLQGPEDLDANNSANEADNDVESQQTTRDALAGSAARVVGEEVHVEQDGGVLGGTDQGVDEDSDLENKKDCGLGTNEEESSDSEGDEDHSPGTDEEESSDSEGDEDLSPGIDEGQQLVAVHVQTVRKELSMHSKKVGKLKPGDIVAVRKVDESDGHVRVRIGKNRWASYLTATGHIWLQSAEGSLADGQRKVKGKQLKRTKTAALVAEKGAAEAKKLAEEKKKQKEKKALGKKKQARIEAAEKKKQGKVQKKQKEKKALGEKKQARIEAAEKKKQAKVQKKQAKIDEKMQKAAKRHLKAQKFRWATKQLPTGANLMELVEDVPGAKLHFDGVDEIQDLTIRVFDQDRHVVGDDIITPIGDLTLVNGHVDGSGALQLSSSESRGAWSVAKGGWFWLSAPPTESSHDDRDHFVRITSTYWVDDPWYAIFRKHEWVQMSTDVDSGCVVSTEKSTEQVLREHRVETIYGRRGCPWCKKVKALGTNTDDLGANSDDLTLTKFTNPLGELV